MEVKVEMGDLDIKLWVKIMTYVKHVMSEMD